MNVFDNNEIETVHKQYEVEVKERFSKTDAYKEYEQKTADYNKDKWQQVNDGLNAVFLKFAICMKNGLAPCSDEAQALVKELQNYITENYYTCHKEILKGLAKMYVLDERFKNNIDIHADFTAEFVSEAIEIYCK